MTWVFGDRDILIILFISSGEVALADGDIGRGDSR